MKSKAVLTRDDDCREGCDEVRVRLSRFLKNWRQNSKLPLKALAKDIGVSIETISAWERGSRFPGAEHLDALALYVGIPVCRLFCDRRENGKKCSCVPKRDST